MALPPVVPCKVSSESAGYVTMTRVERVDLPLRGLAARILGICGKDGPRIARILARGTLVSGDSRYRWSPIQASADEIAKLLDQFPDHDPDAEFEVSRCIRLVFQGARGEFELARGAGRQRRLFRRRNFWDEALEVLASLGPSCQRYSYAEAAHVFAVRLTPAARDDLAQLASLLRFTSVEAQLRSLPVSDVRLYAADSRASG